MLSLRRIQEAGFRGMADDGELEGEACSDDDDGGGIHDGFVDPDVALSYIDEKLQHVLGHFQKEFEGGVSAQNLGPKFGGYGSFLPTCQRSPTPLPQTRSPPKVANISTSRSPYQQSAENMGQNPSTVGVESISRNNGTMAPSSGDLCKKERSASTNAEKDSVVSSDSLDSSFNGSDQKAVKVRIKVGSSNALAKMNASIYSGLGLDISSSSSMEGSPDRFEGLSPEFSNVPYESPRTMLQIMTCFSVPGGFLLSPLRGNILQLTNKVAPLLKKWEKHMDVENLPRTYEGHSELALQAGRFGCQASKKMKSDSKKRKSMDTKTRKDIDDTNAIMNKYVKIETPACKEIVPDTPSIPCFSCVPTTELKGVSQFAEESTRKACIPKPYQQNKDVRLKEKIGGNDLATVKAEAIKTEATKHKQNGTVDNSGTAYRAKGKVKFKTSKERDITNHNYSPFDRKKEHGVKSERKYEGGVVDFEGNEDKKDWEVGPCEDSKKAPGKETLTSDRFEGDNSQTEVTRVQKERKINASVSSDLLKDNNCTHSSAAVKDRKTDSRLNSNYFEKKAKDKSQKDLGENLAIESQGDKEGGILENRSAQGESRQKDKIMNDDNEKELDISGAAREEIPESVKHAKLPALEEQELHISLTSRIATTSAASLPASVVIDEHWVCCDMCQKWRLLPYGTNPSMLPKKWKCSMLNWLPGMNRCDIGEDETTDALNALYVTQVPADVVSFGGSHTTAAGTAASRTYNRSGQLEQSRKRKSALKGGNGSVESSLPAPSSIPLMRNQQAPNKDKNTVDGELYSSERESLSKHGLGPVSKSVGFDVEKQKFKRKNHSSYSDGGKHSKFQNNRGIDQDEHKTSKKNKREDQHHFDRGWNRECHLAGGVHDETKIFPAKEKPIKSSSEQSDISLRKEKVFSRYDLLEKPERIDDEDLTFGKEKKERHEDVETLDLSGKRKLVKEWEEIQRYSMDHASEGAKNENLKERKLKIMKSEMTSKMDSRPVKVQDADTVLSSTEGHLNNELVAHNKFVAGKEVSSKLWENLPPRQALELAEPNRRDAAYLQTSTVATSSSSKISSSRRNKNSQEAKGSPVESVSSSPLRNFNIEKLSDGRITEKEGSLNAESRTTHSSCIKVCKLYNGQQARSFDDNQAAGAPILHCSLQGSSDSNNMEVAHLVHAQVSDGTHLECGLDNNLPKVSWRKDLAANSSCVGRGDSYLCSGDKTDLDMHGPSPQPDHQNIFDSTATALDTEFDSIAHDSKYSMPSRRGRHGSSNFLSHGNKRTEVSFRKEKSQPRIDNQDTQKPIVAQVAYSRLREGKSEVHSTPVKYDAPKMKSQLRKSNIENGEQHGTKKQAISSTSDTASPIRKDSSMVAFALKEARDLKHMANHLKDKGQELESIGLYFEAALKFLHVASLLETPSFDSSRPADAAQSMKMYSDTAKLCIFCAHAYERCKEMAAAALAYKCVEVAYLKAAYYKHPSASKDRRELQAVVQIAPGESPSSSASDINNLNNHGASKAPSTKGGNSPQVAGNLLPLAVRNQAHLLRLLAYTNDVNCAFDATRKSQIAISSADGNQERRKHVDDGLGSVRTVLDFNFNNVNELLRLVRLSMESISRKHQSIAPPLQNNYEMGKKKVLEISCANQEPSRFQRRNGVELGTMSFCEPCRNLVYSRLTHLFVTELEPETGHLDIVHTPETGEIAALFPRQTICKPVDI